MSTDPKAWLAALSTLALYSFLYKENAVYRFAEHLFVGLSAGYALAVGYDNIRTAALMEIAQGHYVLLIPCVLGLCLYARFLRKYEWLARYPISILIGIGTGMSLRGIPSSQIVTQIRSAIVPLNSINNVILVVGVLGALAYFLLTVEHKGTVGKFATIGKEIMMVGFGATFATDIFDEISLLIGTFRTILGSWLGIVKF